MNVYHAATNYGRNVTHHLSGCELSIPPKMFVGLLVHYNYSRMGNMTTTV